MVNKYLATLNGLPTTAQKRGGRWMVGGDFDTSGVVQIILEVNGQPAWHTLKGFVLKFSDYASEEELTTLKEAVGL